jgi:hypothetical protein
MDPEPALDSVEIRVLGTLLEKAKLTPEYYPLSLNALTLACNQKTSREPVSDYAEDTVLAALDRLRDKGLAWRVDVAGSRVPRYRHRLDEAWELAPPAYALLCVLFLRGAQTLGQLRQRCERLHAFADLDAVEACLGEMADRAEQPHSLVRRLPRLPGTKEIRFTHVWAPAEAWPDPLEPPVPAMPPQDSPTELRFQALETAMAELRDRVASLEARWTAAGFDD